MARGFAILNPCPKKWSDLSGEGRVRFCDICHKNVHALDEYSSSEQEALLRESGGHLCGLIAGATPEPVRSRRAVLLGALLSAAAPLFAQSGRVRSRVTDATGAVVPGAEVSQLGKDGKTLRSQTADSVGEVVWTDLALGDTQFQVHCPGFKNLELAVTVLGSSEKSVEAQLEIGSTLGEVITVDFLPGQPLPEERSWIPQTLDLPSPARSSPARKRK
jgi:hypothetical protein